MAKYLMVLITSAVLFSCAAYQPPQKYTFNKKATIDKPFDEVWTGILKWFSEHNTPIKNMDKSSGFISTEYNLSASNLTRYVDCGKPGNFQEIGEQIGNFSIMVEKQGDNVTIVTISVFFKGVLFTQDFTQNTTYANRKYTEIDLDCESTGVLEKEIFDFISK